MPATQTDRIDGLTTSIAVKAPVKAATTGPITFVGSAPSGYQTIDGIACTDNINVTDGLPDRVLVKDQVDETQNGIYLVSSIAWSRALDFDGARDAVNGTLVPVIEGTDNGGTFWMCVATDTKGVVFGTSAITFRAWPYSWGNGGGGTRGDVTILRDIVFRFDNSGAPIQPGVLGYFRTSFAGTIVSWTLLGDGQDGALELDVWKDAYADDSLPTVSNTIVASAPPAIADGHKSKSSGALTGWTTAIAAGEQWGINCNSCSIITSMTLILHVTSTAQVQLT